MCIRDRHSAVEAALRKQDLIDVIQPSGANPFSTYMGKRVIIDDGCPCLLYTSQRKRTRMILYYVNDWNGRKIKLSRLLTVY